MGVELSEGRFVGVYDRVVRRFWADPNRPLTLDEFRRIVFSEGLTYPELAGTGVPPLTEADYLPWAVRRSPADDVNDARAYKVRLPGHTDWVGLALNERDALADARANWLKALATCG